MSGQKLGELAVSDCEQWIRKAAEEITYAAAGIFSDDPPSAWFAELEQELVDAISKAAAEVKLQPPTRYRVGSRAA